MKFNILFLFIGFILGLAASAASVFDLISKYTVKTIKEAETNIALADTRSCGAIQAKDITGLWQGEKGESRWQINFGKDGHYTLTFFTSSSDQASSHFEGLWSYSGCLLNTAHSYQKKDGELIALSNIYRVLSLDHSAMHYAHIDGGTEYTSYRITN